MSGIFNVDSIYRNVEQFGSILVKHRVNLFQKDKNNKSVPYGKIFTSQKSGGGRQGFPSVAFRSTKDSIILESGFVYNENDEYKRPNSVLLSYNDVADVKRCFSDVTMWFTEQPYKNELFKYDNVSGVPFGLTQKYETLNVTIDLKSGLRGAFLAIKPGVIIDPLNSIGYPGVIIIGQQGVVGSCTMTEFMSLRDIVINSLNNLYSISVDLINQYLLASIGGK